MHPRGLISLCSNANYYVQPWPVGDSKDVLTHKIFQLEQLLNWNGACGHRDTRNMTRLSRATQIRVRGADSFGSGNAVSITLQTRTGRHSHS